MKNLKREILNLGIALCHVAVQSLWFIPFFVISAIPLVTPLYLIFKTDFGVILSLLINLLSVWIMFVLLNRFKQISDKYEVTLTNYLLKKIPAIPGPSYVTGFYKLLVTLLIVGPVFLYFLLKGFGWF
jgi:hypothetical protein